MFARQFALVRKFAKPIGRAYSQIHAHKTGKPKNSTCIQQSPERQRASTAVHSTETRKHSLPRKPIESANARNSAQAQPLTPLRSKSAPRKHSAQNTRRAQMRSLRARTNTMLTRCNGVTQQLIVLHNTQALRRAHVRRPTTFSYLSRNTHGNEHPNIIRFHHPRGLHTGHPGP
jgi:hypothetical protein